MKGKIVDVNGKRHPVIYVSTTLDGFHALEVLLSHKKRIDLVITLPRKAARNVSDFADFRLLTSRYLIPVKYTTNINALDGYLKCFHPNLIIVNGWSQLLDS